MSGLKSGRKRAKKNRRKFEEKPRARIFIDSRAGRQGAKIRGNGEVAQKNCGEKKERTFRGVFLERGEYKKVVFVLAVTECKKYSTYK